MGQLLRRRSPLPRQAGSSPRHRLRVAPTVPPPAVRRRPVESRARRLDTSLVLSDHTVRGLSGVRAAAKPCTRAAPAARRACAAAVIVAPVVTTSSTSSTRPSPGPSRTAKTGPCSRAAPGRPVSRGPRRPVEEGPQRAAQATRDQPGQQSGLVEPAPASSRRGRRHPRHDIDLLRVDPLRHRAGEEAERRTGVPVLQAGDQLPAHPLVGEQRRAGVEPRRRRQRRRPAQLGPTGRAWGRPPGAAARAGDGQQHRAEVTEGVRHPPFSQREGDRARRRLR